MNQNTKQPHKHAEVIKANVGRFDYESSGFLRWNDNYGPRARRGNRVGCEDSSGYLQVKLAGKMVLVHRIIWFMHNGTLPDQVDHINRKRTDNRIENLRESCNLLNTQNAGVRKDNKSGTPGVNYRNGRWVARIAVDGARLNLGVFDTVDQASAAYKAAKLIYHPHAAIIAEVNP